MQRHVQPTLPQAPATVMDETEPVPAAPVHAPETTPVTAVDAPSISCPAPCPAQPPTPAATPRRSTRAGRGMTSTYDDYIKHLLRIGWGS